MNGDIVQAFMPSSNVFYLLLLLLFISWVFIFVLFNRHTTKLKRSLEEELRFAEARSSELIALKDEKDSQLQERSLELNRTREVTASLQQEIISYKTTIDEKNSEINGLRQQNEHLQVNFKEAQSALNKVREEVSLKTQICDGLKGQYDELEKDFMKLIHNNSLTQANVQKTEQKNTRIGASAGIAMSIQNGGNQLCQ